MGKDHLVIRDPRALQRVGITTWPAAVSGDTLLNPKTRFERHAQHPPGCLMPLGAYSYSHSHFQVDTIGRYCSIGAKVTTMGNAHPIGWVTTSPLVYRSRRRARWQIAEPANSLGFDDRPPRTLIGNDVWIGQDVLLRAGISIGTGAVIGAGSVVTRDVPAYHIVAGNPARLIRLRFEPQLATALLESRWWMFEPDELIDLQFDDPAAFLAQFSRLSNLREKPLDYRSVLEHLTEANEPDAVELG